MSQLNANQSFTLTAGQKWEIDFQVNLVPTQTLQGSQASNLSTFTQQLLTNLQTEFLSFGISNWNLTNLVLTSYTALTDNSLNVGYAIVLDGTSATTNLSANSNMSVIGSSSGYAGNVLWTYMLIANAWPSNPIYSLNTLQWVSYELYNASNSDSSNSSSSATPWWSSLLEWLPGNWWWIASLALVLLLMILAKHHNQ